MSKHAKRPAGVIHVPTYPSESIFQRNLTKGTSVTEHAEAADATDVAAVDPATLDVVEVVKVEPGGMFARLGKLFQKR